MSATQQHVRVSFLTLLCLLTFLIAISGQFTSAQQPEFAPTAVIEKAKYQARMEGTELVEGTLQFEINHLEKKAAFLDWSGVQLAIHNLMQADKSKVIWGTDAQQRQLVRISESVTLLGQWTLHGKQIGDRIHFDVSLPPALESVLNLQLPDGFVPHASRGLISPSPTPSVEGWKMWTLECGKHRTLTVEVQRTPEIPIDQESFCEADAVHVIRRDGVYIQNDMVFQSRDASLEKIQLKVPSKLKIQSITSFGVQIPYERSEAASDLVTLSLKGENNRVSIRVQGMVALNWDRKRTLPEIRPINATLVSKNVAVRVESPLKIINIESEGYIQTNLSALPTGEIWSFNLVNHKGRLVISTLVPKPVSTYKLDCLLDLRTQSAWGNCLLQVASQSGEEFEASLTLPPAWEVVSVDPNTPDSKVADWEFTNGTLNVHFRESVSNDHSHAVMIQVLGETFELNQPISLQLPKFPEGQSQQSQFHLVLPKGFAMEILEGDGWEVSENSSPTPELMSQLSEETLVQLQGLQVATLTFHETLATAPVVQIVKRESALLPNSTNHPITTTDLPLIEAGRPSSTLQLSTKFGRGQSQGIVHHAYFHFDRASELKSIGLELDSSARISSVIVDGLPVTVILDGEHVVFPSELEAVTTLEVIYITQRNSQRAVQSSKIPIPTIVMPVENFEWSITTPPDHIVTQVDLPEYIWGNRADPEPQLRFYGPLTRLSGRKIFNPLSGVAWQGMFSKEDRNARSASENELFEIFSDTAPQHVEITLRNDVVLRGYAWIAFVSCLLIGTGARMFRVRHLRNTTIIWLICLGFVVFLTSENWAIVAGGLLTGTIVSLLLPRRLIRSKDLFLRFRKPEQELPPKLLPSAATSAGLILLCFLLSPHKQIHSQNLDSVSAPSPKYLIESALYELINFSPAPEIKATFSVNLLDENFLNKDVNTTTTGEQADDELPPPIQSPLETLLIQLPFQGVVFQSGATCKVNGDEQPLIPTTDGSGVLVDLSRLQFALRSQSKDEANLQSREAIKIELAFTIKPQASETSQPSFSASVPRVMNSTLQFREELQMDERWGANISTDELQSLSLGACGKLAPHESKLPTPVLDNIEAITVLNLSGLRIDGETRLSINETPTLKKNGPSLLKLPEHLLLKDVTGDLKSWKQITNSNGNSVLVVDWSETSSLLEEKTLLLNYMLAQPAQINEAGQLVTIPAFSFQSGVQFSHKMGIASSPGFSIEIQDPDPSFRTIGSIEWNTLPAPSRTQPKLMFELFSPQPIQLQFQAIPVTRTASISETLTIQKQTLKWQARVNLEVGVLPVFRHDFHITPGIEITEIVELEESHNLPVRWKQTNDNLTLFLTEGQFGKQSFSITGTKRFAAESWRSLPSIKVPLADVLSSELTIIDETFWNLKLESASGTTLATPPKPTNVSHPVSRTVGIFKDGQRPRPIRVQAIPPVESTLVDSVSRLTQRPDGIWNLTTTFHFKTDEAPLRQFQFTIPNSLTQINVRPAFYRRVTLPGEEASLLTIRLTGNTKTTLDITIDTILDPASIPTGSVPTELSLIKVASAKEVARYFILEPNSPISLSPNSGQRISIGALPEWTNLAVKPRVEADAICHQLSETQNEANLPITLSPRVATNSQQARVFLVETIFWTPTKLDASTENATTSIPATSQVWLNASQARELVIELPDSADIEKVLQDGGPSLPLRIEQNRCYVALSKDATSSAITVYWNNQNVEAAALELLKFPAPSGTASMPEPQQLIAISNAPHISFSQTLATTKPLNMWLMRWSSMLEILRENNASIPVDSPLLRTIRLCERNAQRLIEQDASPELWSEYQHLQTQWDQFRRGLIVSVEDNTSLQSYSPTSFNDLLGEASHEVAWIPAPSTEWKAIIVPTKYSWFQLLLKLIALIAAAALALTSLRTLVKVPDEIADFPDASLVILGLVWWLCLSPSFIGLLVCLVGLCLGIADRIGRNKIAIQPES